MPILTSRTPEFHQFWTERHLAILTTVRTDGTPHSVPVGVTVDFEAELARVITSGPSFKARLIAASGTTGTPVSLAQVDGRRWSTIEGLAVVRSDGAAVAEAERRYAERFRTPRINPARVVIEVSVRRVLGNQ